MALGLSPGLGRDHLSRRGHVDLFQKKEVAVTTENETP